jgi:hypothetical protein
MLQCEFSAHKKTTAKDPVGDQQGLNFAQAAHGQSNRFPHEVVFAGCRPRPVPPASTGDRIRMQVASMRPADILVRKPENMEYIYDITM